MTSLKTDQITTTEQPKNSQGSTTNKTTAEDAQNSLKGKTKSFQNEAVKKINDVKELQGQKLSQDLPNISEVDEFQKQNQDLKDKKDGQQNQEEDPEVLQNVEIEKANAQETYGNNLNKETKEQQEPNQEQTTQGNQNLKQPNKQSNGAGHKKNDFEKMTTRSRRPSVLQPYQINMKKRMAADDSQVKEDSEMQDELSDRDSLQSEDPVVRKQRKKVKPRNPMPNLMNKSKPKVVPYQRREINTQGIRLDKLSYGTLRRYQYFFKLEKNSGKPFITDKDQLLELVEDHFTNHLKVDPVDVFYNFFVTKKDPEDQMHLLRNGVNTRRITRNEQ